MKIDSEIADSLSDKKGHVLFLPLLNALNDLEDQDKELFLMEALKRDGKDSSEEEIATFTRYVLDVHNGVEPMPGYCTGFKVSLNQPGL